MAGRNRLDRSGYGVLALLATVAMTLVFACAASAATYTPNVTADNNATTDPVDITDCPADAEATDDCTLREAVEAANDTDVDDVVEVPAGTYLLDPSIEGSHGITVAPEPDGGELRIHGAGARGVTVIDGGSDGDTARVFTFDSGSIAEVQDAEITGGFGNGGSNGGAIKIRDNQPLGDADVTFTRVWLTGNSAENSGGAISNRGILFIQDSLLSGNNAGQDGGAIENDDELTIVDSTLTDNHANGGVEVLAVTGSGTGGAINNTGVNTEEEEDSTMDLFNTTIAGNSATLAGGGVFTEVDTPSLVGEPRTLTTYENSIVAKNSAPEGTNCFGNEAQDDPDPSSFGHNLENGTSCEFTAAGDRNADPLLGPLANNGGPTNTLAELNGSPAIDAGNNDTCTEADQRGVGRPQGPVCDIGAYERGPAVAVQPQQPAVVQTQSVTQQANQKKCKDHLPPITHLRNSGLTLKSGSVKLKGRSRDRGKPCPVGVKRVEVTLAQVSGTGLNCRFQKFKDHFALSPFRNCRRRSIRFKANGTRHWKFTFNVSLEPGKYRATARGYDKLRHKETPKKRRNIIYFTVK